MRTEIKELHQRLKTTTIYVTHDQIEAMTMADKIVVMHAGRVEQIGAPLELYDTPANHVRRRLHRLAVDELPKGPPSPQRNGRSNSPGGGALLPLAAAPRQRRTRRDLRRAARTFRHRDDGGGAEAAIQVIEPTGAEIQVVAKLGGEDIIAVFRERHHSSRAIRSGSSQIRSSFICSTRLGRTTHRLNDTKGGRS